jgi:osmotically inducible protein OsmC
VDKDGDGFTITKSALDLKAKVSGIDAEEFERIALDAKANCPVSKVLNAEITLTHALES